MLIKSLINKCFVNIKETEYNETYITVNKDYNFI